MTAAGDRTNRRLLIVGNPETHHIGRHLQRAAEDKGLTAGVCDVRAAFAAPWPILQFNWRLRGHRPPRLRWFSDHVLEACRSFRPKWLLTTGLAPVSAPALQRLGGQRIIRINYLTDDPWNPARRGSWFLRAVACYDRVFSPRHSNLEDLARAGCRQVAYLPFGYAPDIHYPEAPHSVEERQRFDCDLLFFGGADPDRVPYIVNLIRAGLKVHLYGGYWERYLETRERARGHADPPTLRKAVSSARVTLCLVRRANRDGSVMRTFEAPAMGACMLVEDTPEHREILGETVVYFRTMEQMVEKARWLVDHDDERHHLATAAHNRIVRNGNTYHDRLSVMLAP